MSYNQNQTQDQLDTSGLEDKTVVCRDCKNEFVFTARDQAFYVSKGYGEPKGCKPCRDDRKRGRDGGAPAPAGGFNQSGGYNAGSGYTAPATKPSYGNDAPRNDRKPAGKKRRGGSDDDRW